MSRVCILLAILFSLLCAASAPASRIIITRAKAKARPRPTRVAKAPKKLPLPGPVDANSLGFGSTRADVERLLGKPTRVLKVERKEILYYGLSTVTLGAGRVIAWSTYDQPLPVNIGTAKPNPPRLKTGSTAAQLVAAKGTPNTVAVSGRSHLWFYGTVSFALRDGRLIPADVPGQLEELKTGPGAKSGKPSQIQHGPQPGCYCPL